MKTKLRLLVCILATVVFSTFSLMAQSNEGSLSGTITDSTGKSVPAAVVTAVNSGTGQSFKSTTTENGQYRFPVLAIGDYKISVAATGFKTAERTNVAVQIQSTVSLDIELAVGASTETVEVTADSLQLQTESADIGTVVTPKQVLDLPLSTNGSAIRNSQDFVFLTPATYGTGTNGGTFEGGVSGGQAFGSEILFDGASLQVESFGDGFANEILPSVEATGEFKVLVGGIPAQYGRTTGGVQTYASKTGTNAFHGGAFELFRNTALDANTWFNNYAKSQGQTGPGVDTPADKKNNYGVLLGGPVWIPKIYDGRNKTFFFFTWEQFRQHQGYQQLITIPTAANIAGDFSANLGAGLVDGQGHPIINPCDGTQILAGQVFDPTTTKTLDDGTQCRTAFAGNKITSGISSVSAAIAKLIPAPSNNNLTNNYNWTGVFPIISTTDTIRIDHSFGPSDKIFGSYSVRDNVRNNNNGQLSLPVIPFLTSQDLPTHLVRVGYDHIFSSNLLNHSLLAFSRVLNLETYTTVAKGTDWSQTLGLPGGSGPLFPGIGLTDGSTIGLGNSEPLSNQGYNSKISDNAFYFADSIVWSKGKHNLAIGGEFRYAPSVSGFQSLTNGNFTFGREQTAANVAQASSTGKDTASFLLGQVGSVFATNSLVSVKNIEQYGALYVQDEYKASRDLNVSLGLRYDVDVPFREKHDFGSQFDPTVINPATGTAGALVFSGNGPNRDGFSSRWVDVYYKNVEPRVGLTWAPSYLDHKSVFSASYDILNAGIFEWQQIYAGIPAGYSLTAQINNNSNPFIPGEFLDPTSAASPVVANPGLYGVPAVGSAVNYDRSQLNNNSIPWNQRGFGRPGFYQTWGASVQQQLATDLIFTLGYLGSRGTHLGSNLLSVNNIPVSAFALGEKLNNSANGVPYASFNGTVAQSLRPFPQYTTINTAAFGENRGQLSYNAMTAKLERRFHNGMNLLASYTWSKILTDSGNIIGGSLGGAYTANIQNPTNLKAEKAVSPEDTPHIFVVSYLYQLPFGKGGRFLNKGQFTNYVVGGWSFSGIQRYQSGQPLGFASATGVPGFNNGIRWNLVAGQQIHSDARRGGSFNPTRDVWYNRAAFSDPNANVQGNTPYSFGNKPAYQSNDRSFAYEEEDFGLIKRTPITERVGLQFRAEFFNAFNRHVFGNPDNNPNDGDGFGKVGGTNNSPRAGQLTLRLEF